MSSENRWLLSGIGVTTAVLLGTAFAIAKVAISDFAGHAWMIAPPSGGNVNCIGGTPTGAWPPCTPGGKGQVRGMILTYRQEAQRPDSSPEPLATGTRTIHFYYTGEGDKRQNHAWGTWRFDLDEGIGAWEGTFTGFGGGVPNHGQIVGHGVEGQVEGLELRATYSYESFPGLETISGFIINPGTK